MKKLTQNWHWLFFMLTAVSFFTGLVYFTYSAASIIAVIFGAVGLVAVGILMFYVQKQKGRQQKESS